jgi:hypothetical protein
MLEFQWKIRVLVVFSFKIKVRTKSLVSLHSDFGLGSILREVKFHENRHPFLLIVFVVKIRAI